MLTKDQQVQEIVEGLGLGLLDLGVQRIAPRVFGTETRTSRSEERDGTSSRARRPVHAPRPACARGGQLPRCSYTPNPPPSSWSVSDGWIEPQADERGRQDHLRPVVDLPGGVGRRQRGRRSCPQPPIRIVLGPLLVPEHPTTEPPWTRWRLLI